MVESIPTSKINRIRPPQHLVQTGFPAKLAHVDSTRHNRYAVARQPLTLLDKIFTVPGKRNPPLRIDHPVPRHTAPIGRIAERPADKTRVPWITGKIRDHAITGHFPLGYARHDITNPPDSFCARRTQPGCTLFNRARTWSLPWAMIESRSRLSRICWTTCFGPPLPQEQPCTRYSSATRPTT